MRFTTFQSALCVSGDKPYVPSREINAALEALRAMAAAEPASAIPAEGANKKIPDGLRAALGEFFIGIYDRQDFYTDFF